MQRFPCLGHSDVIRKAWLLGTAIAVAALAGCAQPKYVHCVFFDVKEGTPDSEIDAMVADGEELLSTVPTVRRVESGRRDPASTGQFNDLEFDVGLVVYFDDKAGLDAYHDHPTHQVYVDRHRPHWQNIRVCDFTAE